MNAIAATLFVGCLAGPAWSHSAPQGWLYDSKCCSGRDCAVIDASHVHVTPDGYVVVLDAGDHPLVTKRITGRFGFVDGDPANDRLVGQPREARRSGDSNYHACVTPGRVFLCLYVPDTGA